jgi:hypothetical protein
MIEKFKAEYRHASFQMIKDTIDEYYPIASEEVQLDGSDLEGFSKFKSFRKLIGDNFSSYDQKWDPFVKHLELVLAKSVSAHPAMDAPCLSGTVEIASTKVKDLTWTKELKFYISLLGPYYCIYGFDYSTVDLELNHRRFTPNTTDKGHFMACNAITISPEFEYKDAFIRLKQEIGDKFPQHRFVPYQVGMTRIEEIATYYRGNYPRSNYMDSIYTGLFGTECVKECLTRGDRYYGFDEWRPPLSSEQSELLEAIKQHVVEINDKKLNEITIHKVWKVSETNIVKETTFRPPGMMGIDWFILMDLTKEGTSIVTFKGGEPDIAKYEVQGDSLIFGPTSLLKVRDLTSTTLKAVLHLQIEIDGKEIKGDVCQLLFIAVSKPSEIDPEFPASAR